MTAIRPILVVAAPIGRLSAAAVGAAAARGLAETGRDTDLAESVDDPQFDRRLRAAGAAVVCADVLDRALLRDTTFAEAATRARQTGVPCFAIVGCNGTDAFDERILDLQVVRTARNANGIANAAQALAPHLPSS